MSKETELYDLLQISTSSSADDIKKAFRKAALKHHPDRGGNEEMFKKINHAYEILSDPNKKEIYDKYGKDGLKNSGSVPDDMFSSMFGQMFGGMFNPMNNFFNNMAKRKTVSTIHQYKVSLEQLCTKKVIKLKVTRDRVCQCASDSNCKNCDECKGNGVKTLFRQMGPMIQQINQPCSSCKGLGKIYNFCGKCKEGLVVDPKVFELQLSPELENGYKFIFKEEGNQDIGCLAGDFVVIMVYEKHPLFEVQGQNLVYTRSITLKEALCGHSLNMNHPSGEMISLDFSQITTPYTVRIIQNKGLTTNGNLEIRYKIEFPEKLDKHQVELFRDLL